MTAEIFRRNWSLNFKNFVLVVDLGINFGKVDSDGSLTPEKDSVRIFGSLDGPGKTLSVEPVLFSGTMFFD